MKNKDVCIDHIIAATAQNGLIRVYGAETAQAVETARKIHQTSPVVTAALGRLMTATLLMGSMQKGGATVTCRINGDGQLSGAVAFSNARGQVKGYPLVSVVDIPLKSTGKLDVSGAIGAGFLTVSKDLGLKEPYAGRIPLVSGEIAEDFAQYYTVSEQTPSAVALGVLVDTDYSVKRAGGLIIQLLPGATDETADLLTERLNKMEALTTQLDEGVTITQIMENLFAGLDLSLNEKIPSEFHCGCNREKLYSVLAAIGKKELEDILANEKRAELKCHFCNSSHIFDEGELKALLSNGGNV